MLSYKYLAAVLFALYDSESYKLSIVMLFAQAFDYFAFYADPTINWEAIKSSPFYVHVGFVALAQIIYLAFGKMKNKRALQWTAFLIFFYCSVLVPLIAVQARLVSARMVNYWYDSLFTTLISVFCARFYE